jgi:hypothetical protein
MQQEFVADLRVRLLWNHNTDSYARSMFEDAAANATALHSLVSTLRVWHAYHFLPCGVHRGPMFMNNVNT